MINLFQDVKFKQGTRICNRINRCICFVTTMSVFAST